MGKYIVTSGQNLFDAALHIYGSIEGIIDLMMNNSGLSLSGTLKSGDELLFSDDYIIDAGVVACYRMNNIVPANGERNVYYKTSNYPLLIEILVDNKDINVSFSISGRGIMEIDWGDNSVIEKVALQKDQLNIRHFFDNTIPDKRKIRIYGDFPVIDTDLSGLGAKEIYVYRPLSCERLILDSSRTNLMFLSLFGDLLKLSLQDGQFGSLMPLVECKNLMEINLSGTKLKKESVDQYLIALVERHHGRRNCTITLTAGPTGEYREPARDENSDYRITSGMEAVWLLCNEPSWNEGGYWKFNINDKIYTSGNGQDN